MKKKVFVTSDLWFNRPNGNMSEETTYDYHELIVENWNKTVNKNDIVYILGGMGISDMYHIVSKLNGEIHVLNNSFTVDEKNSINLLKTSIEKGVDSKLRKRVIFEHDQIMTLPKYDVILSYFPLSNWYGQSSGTLCFCGFSDTSDLKNNRITCKSDIWDFTPVNIEDIKLKMEKFKKKF